MKTRKLSTMEKMSIRNIVYHTFTSYYSTLLFIIHSSSLSNRYSWTRNSNLSFPSISRSLQSDSELASELHLVMRYIQVDSIEHYFSFQIIIFLRGVLDTTIASYSFFSFVLHDRGVAS